MDEAAFYFSYIKPEEYYSQIAYTDFTVLYRLYCSRILYSDCPQEYRHILKRRVHIAGATGKIVSLNLTRLLSGTVPEYIAELTELKYLFLESCQLTDIPHFLGDMPRLYHLYIDYNELQIDVNLHLDTALSEGRYPALYILSCDQMLAYIA